VVVAEEKAVEEMDLAALLPSKAHESQAAGEEGNSRRKLVEEALSKVWVSLFPLS